MENKIHYALPLTQNSTLHHFFSTTKQITGTDNKLIADIIARYRLFHEKAKKSAAVEKFCAHGGRYIFWLPYRFNELITIFISCNVNTSRGWDDISGTVNVTYFGDESPFTLEEVFSHRRKSSVATRYTDQNRCKRKMAASQVWRKNNPKSNQRPFCVTTRLCVYHKKSI